MKNYVKGAAECLLPLVLLAAAPCRARADLVTNLSTGFDNATGMLLTPFSVDTKYSVIGPDGNTYYPQARTAAALPSSYIGDAALPGSRWDYLTLTPTSTGSDFVPVGNYVFTTTVNLTGFNAATARISGLQVSTDNAFLSVAINGTVVFSRMPTGDVIEEFGVILDVGDVGLGAFHDGLNTIQFTIFNQGFGGDGSTIPSPAAFRAQATLDAAPQVGAVPEPSGLALLGMGLLCLLRRRRRGKALWA